MICNKEIRQEIKILKRLCKTRGIAAPILTKKKRYVTVDCNGGKVRIPTTPSDWRSIKNMKSDFRKYLNVR